jgi:uncharacterized membrane protein YdjX (TVP38/TMEM64 family)
MNLNLRSLCKCSGMVASSAKAGNFFSGGVNGCVIRHRFHSDNHSQKIAFGLSLNGSVRPKPTRNFRWSAKKSSENDAKRFLKTPVMIKNIQNEWFKAMRVVPALLLLLTPAAAQAVSLESLVPVVESTVSSAGPFAPLVFIVLYGISAVLLIPASILTISAGFLFGPWLGTAVVSIAATFGAALAFLIGRYFARDYVETMMSSNDRYVAINRAISSQGSRVVFLMRLSPLFPYSLINYSLGLTQIRFSEYIIASWLGMLPGTIAYVALGSASKAIFGDFSLQAVLLSGFGAMATLGVTFLISREASKALNDMNN